MKARVSTISKLAKGVLWLLGAILLGGLGSGFWEYVLEGVFISIGELFLSVASALSDTFLSSLYADIKNGPVASYSRTTLSLVTGMYFGLLGGFLGLFSSLYRRLRGRGSSTSEMPRPVDAMPSRKVIAVTALALLSILFMQSFISMKTMFTGKAAIYLDSGIEIVSPAVGDEKRLQLRASYRQVDSRERFVALYLELHRIAAENGIDLVEFDYY